MKGILEKWTREDLPNKGLRDMSDIIGVNETKALMFKCKGLTVTFPKTFDKQSDLNYIEKNMDLAPEVVAHNLGLSLRSVYRKRQEVRNNQITAIP